MVAQSGNVDQSSALPFQAQPADKLRKKQVDFTPKPLGLQMWGAVPR